MELTSAKNSSAAPLLFGGGAGRSPTTTTDLSAVASAWQEALRWRLRVDPLPVSPDGSATPDDGGEDDDDDDDVAASDATSCGGTADRFFAAAFAASLALLETHSLHTKSPASHSLAVFSPTQNPWCQSPHVSQQTQSSPGIT